MSSRHQGLSYSLEKLLGKILLRLYGAQPWKAANFAASCSVKAGKSSGPAVCWSYALKPCRVFDDCFQIKHSKQSPGLTVSKVLARILARY